MTHGTEVEVGYFADRVDMLVETMFDCWRVVAVSDSGRGSKEDGFRFVGVEAEAVE
jgi:hypothetical protein